MLIILFIPDILLMLKEEPLFFEYYDGCQSTENDSLDYLTVGMWREQFVEKAGSDVEDNRDDDVSSRFVV